MATNLAFRLRSRLLLQSSSRFRTTFHQIQSPHIPKSSPLISSALSDLRRIPDNPIFNLSGFRFFSTARRNLTRPKHVDIGARARQLQTRRLWTYALTFSCIAGFVVIVLSNFQEHLMFYVTPTDALEKFSANPAKNKFRLGGLVLEGSVTHPASSSQMEFVITDLITDMLVRHQGSLPDLFREGHSVVVEGFLKPFTDEIRNEISTKSVSEKARSEKYYFSAIEVLAKHDEKYMPAEVGAAIEKNRKKIEEGELGVNHA
ncbi:hypothetical protein IC582_003357 [Cucumis melo]|uniref:Cytochrome c-type biogenesis protein CcmE n=2 Tax=Cucumis melo TaxID=3656 RepID=A0A1S3BP93_CUCME|nr:cytochrome c-type biogenesis protein CcmE homolog, mitochondrial [Cucumis melo]KAA0059091.1 cytochrome c-type biogenesis protein CcmE [Cucumis melo var. makuwa]